MMRRLSSLACALLIASIVQAQTLEMQTVEGVLHVVWGDPQESALGTAAITSVSPRYRAFITTDAGESVELDPILSRDLTAGDLVSLNGRRVRASGTAAAQRATPLGAGEEPFHALSIQPAISLGNAAFSAAPDWPVQQRPYAIILCKFNDVPDEPLPVSRYEAMYSSGFGGADDFYRELSDGRITIQGTRVYGWYTLPRARSSYVVNDQANLSQLFNDCTRQADPDVDFKQVVGMAMHFNAFLDCCSWGGSRTATLDGVTKTFATMWNASWARSGTSWHEMGHSVGLPHSGGPYGRTYDSVWDVMSASTSGRYLNQDFGFGGAHFIGYHKNLLGLIPAGRRVTVTSGEWRGVVEAHARNANGTGTVLVMVPIADPARFGQAYTLELRAKTGYDVRVPRAALIMHSIVPGRAEPAQIVDGDGDGDPNDDGATWTVGETFSDPSAGIEIQIDSLTVSGVAVTVRNGAGRGATLATGGATFARAYGDATLARDSVRVTGVTTWRSSQRRSWLSLVRGTGSEGEYLSYEIDVRTLAPGRYADTLRVYSASGTSIGAPYVVEVVIAPGTDVAALSVIARRDSSRTGVTSNVDSTFLSLQGRYANSAWTAVRSSQRLFIGSRLANGNLVVDLTTTQINGVGSRWVYFRRGPESLVGRTVDTLTVTIADATPITLRMVDTLDAFAPISARLTRTGGQHRVLQGALGAIDSLSISFDDPRNATLEWFAVNQRVTMNRLRNTRGLGGHTLRWVLDGSNVAGTGTQIDSILVCTTLSAVCAAFVDTLTIDAAPNEMRLSAIGGRSAVVRGTRQRSESLYVQMLGATGRTRPWSASSTTTRIAFHALDAFTANGAGTGSTFLRWSRSTNDLAPGTYVDTVTVHADGVAGAPAGYIDTLVVTAGAPIVGDVDGDGSITTGDALIILRSLVGLPIVASAVVANGDANCDGRVTAADAQLILQLDVGIPPQSSCLGRRMH
ncbi:MAG TPA: dockerin type I domain-containing protein [Gemmatimonadaceae bacterium]|jgi:M6 family metalloprotease-like protein